MHNLETDEREAQNIQQVDVSAMKHVKTGKPLLGRTATDRPLEVPPDNLSPAPSMGTSIIIFVRGGGRTYPRRKLDDKEVQGSERD